MRKNLNECLPFFHKQKWYYSLDSIKVNKNYNLEISCACSTMIKNTIVSLKKNINEYKLLTLEERKNIIKKALYIFANDSVNIDGEEQDVEKFASLLWKYNGIPHKLTYQWLGNLIDEYNAKEDFYSESCKNKIMLISLPSNTFLCLDSCIEALLSGYFLFIRPSSREPFSAIRFLASLVQAGYPKEFLYLYYISRAEFPSILTLFDNIIVFGGSEIEERFGQINNIEIRGPGHTSLIVKPSNDLEKTSDLIVKKICENAGRFCINASIIICLDRFEEISSLVAKKMDCIDLTADDNFPLTHHWDEQYIYMLQDIIKSNMQQGDIVMTNRNLVEKISDEGFMPTPTLIKLNNYSENPLLGMEFPYPFAVIIKADNEDIPFITTISKFVYELEGDCIYMK